MWSSIGRYSKSIGALLVAVQAWGLAVVASSSAQITAAEWMVLAGAGVTFAVVVIVPNAMQSDPPPKPAPPAEGV